MPTQSFETARKFVRSLRLTSANDFYVWTSGRRHDLPPKPKGIPSNPHHVYRDDWAGFPDWLGIDNIATYRRTFAPFEEARAFVRDLNLESGKEWRRYCAGNIPSLGNLPVWLPTNPNLTYRDKGWAGMKDWLGTGDKTAPQLSRMVTLPEARKFARSLRLKSWLEWRAYVSGKRPDLPGKPKDIPAVPNACYRTKGWISYGDFLGCNTVAWHQMKWRSFETARAHVRKLGIRNMAEWRKWVKAGSKPEDIPANPDKAYSASWIGWRDWLG